MAAPAAAKIFSFQDYRAVPDPVLEVSPECLQPSPVPIVIDNGSFQTRAGWACAGDEFSAPRLQFKSVAARSRGAARSETQIGNDIPNLEPLRWLLKSQFDRNVVVNFEIQELMFDYIFMHLGIATESIFIARGFSCGDMEGFAPDELRALERQNTEDLDVRVGPVSFEAFLTLDARNCKRVNMGGSHAASYLQRLLQLKYPGHLAAITLSRMEELLQEHSYTALDYQEELERWRCADFYEREVHRIQLPFSSKLAGSTLSAEERQERRTQQLRRLQELNSRRREEKLQQDQERLERLLTVQELLEDGLLDQFHKALVELNMDSAEELQSYISKLSLAVEQGRQRALQAEGPDSKPEVLILMVVKLIDKKWHFILTTPFLFFRCFRNEIPKPVIRCKMKIFQSRCRVGTVLYLCPSMEEGDGVAELEPEFSEDQPEADKPANPAQPVFNLAEYHQLFVGTERLRVPEILFQPSVIGEEQMGVMETLQYILDRYTPEQQGALAGNVFLTGGNLQYPGMKERVERELLAIRPFQSHFQVTLASRPALDGWYGAREWALRHAGGEEGWVTRKDYEEKGGEYLSEHCCSNTFIPISVARPPPRAADPPPATASVTATTVAAPPATASALVLPAAAAAGAPLAQPRVLA
ncbi:ARP5 protein, partial [Atractosteus spatula]|nr:ARP5 protein [Atractosteus spatula]